MSVRIFNQDARGAFSEAERFKDGANPFIANGKLSNGKPWVATADRNGLFVVYLTVSGEQVQWISSFNDLPASTARELLLLVEEVMNGSRHPRAALERIGFRCISDGKAPRVESPEYVEAMRKVGLVEESA